MTQVMITMEQSSAESGNKNTLASATSNGGGGDDDRPSMVVGVELNNRTAGNKKNTSIDSIRTSLSRRFF